MKIRRFKKNDGGRAQSGRRGSARDCVTRSIAIASPELSYTRIYKIISAYNTIINHTRSGVITNTPRFRLLMVALGFTPFVDLIPVHLSTLELPGESGRWVVGIAGHFTSVVDGVLNDTFDCRKSRSKYVRTAWKKTGWVDNRKIALLI